MTSCEVSGTSVALLAVGDILFVDLLKNDFSVSDENS